MTVEFLILNTEIEIRFCVGRFCFDLFQTESEIKSLFRLNTLFTANLSIMMEDRRKIFELEMRWQAGRINDLVNGSLKTDLGGVPE